MNSIGPEPTRRQGLERVVDDADARLPRAAVDREVASAIAGCDDEVAAEPLEGDIPEPGGVVAVGQPGVDADDDRRGAGGHESMSSAQPAGFFASIKEPARPLT